ncbi:MAG: WecB/TagA/CpsF family glycosyltransferase [bacterium]
MHLQVMGIRIDRVNKKQALEKAEGFLNSDKQHKVFTPNPEMLVDAQKDEYFKKVLNSGDLNICDGFGLWLKYKLSSLQTDRAKRLEGSLERVPGVDFMQDICQIASEQGRSVYLLGSGDDRVIEKTTQKLNGKYSNLKIAGYDKGPDLKNVTSEQNQDLIKRINTTKPDIIFVAFGHGKQEKWIYENLSKLSSIKLAMGVGGAFDYISGKTKRAPRWMQKVGLEWLYRLIKQPKRIKRIFKATFLFLYLVLCFKQKF